MTQTKAKSDFLISEDGELIAARIEPKLKHKFELKCKQNFRTMSDTLRLLIQDYVSKQ